MATLLNIQGLVIYNLTSTTSYHEVKIGRPGREKCCPYCQSRLLKKHGFGRTRRILHGKTSDGLSLFLLWRSRRYRCKTCLRTWSKSPPDWLVAGQRHSSKACELQALRTLRGTSFAETTRQSNLGYQALRRCLFERVHNNILMNVPLEKKISIGIDEHSRAKRSYAITVCLLKPKQELLGIIPLQDNHNLKTWVNHYWTQQEKESVSEVCVDMSGGWKKTISLLFPNAQIVIDHFHVIKYLNDLIKQEYYFFKRGPKTKSGMLPDRTKGIGIVRKLYQGGKYWTDKDKENVRRMFTAHPKIAKLWYWKEEVRRIYAECKDKKEARKRWKIVLGRLDDLPRKTLSNNLESILNYFDRKTTNAYTEGIHTKFKLIKRYSYGFRNHNVYVKKLLLGFTNLNKLIYSNTF